MSVSRCHLIMLELMLKGFFSQYLLRILIATPGPRRVIWTSRAVMVGFPITGNIRLLHLRKYRIRNNTAFLGKLLEVSLEIIRVMGEILEWIHLPLCECPLLSFLLHFPGLVPYCLLSTSF